MWCPPATEDRTHIRTGYRVSADLVRFHQIGVCSGWIDIDGERHEMDPDTWVSTRDHSWGVRYGVGAEPTDVEPRGSAPGSTYHFMWSPMLMERADGSRYGIFLNFGFAAGPGYEHKEVMGGIEHPDGALRTSCTRSTPSSRTTPRTDGCVVAPSHSRWPTERPVDSASRLSPTPASTWAPASTSGSTDITMVNGAVSSTLRGEHIADCAEPATARRVHQIRDTVVRITDPAGGGVGIGNWQPMITGAFPELGLDAESSFT